MSASTAPGPTDPRALTTLVIASSNRAKIIEFKELLRGLAFEVVGVSDVLKEPPQVVESETTFEGNALKKARAVAEATMMLSLADDSGLEVDALGGRPGVRSARFAHERATDAENNAALLAALADVEPDQRNGRFRCVLALVDPFGAAGGAPHITEGTCEGVIATGARGGGGFGYDPLFIVPTAGKTMAELSDTEKNSISHRALAARAMRPILTKLGEERVRDALFITQR
ncbi:MAG: RdgB/HAM1 family non-canonical purine NTP pyrophosphatase [Polyangiaceae bacterium]